MHPHDEFNVYTLEAFAANPDVIRLDTDADFELQRLACFFTPAGAPQTASTRRIPSVIFNLFDSATGRALFAGDANTAELFGDGAVPFVLPTSHWFTRGSQIEVSYNGGPDFDAGRLWLAFIGRKRYQFGAAA